MKISLIKEDKKRYLDLLLLADEQESMIDKYLESGDLFGLFDEDLKSVCVVLGINDFTIELKNIATYPAAQNRGYGRRLIEHVCQFYKGTYSEFLVGTGDVPRALRFYENCGFSRSHVLKDFFTKNYEKPMVEDGIILRDMVYLKKFI